MWRSPAICELTETEIRAKVLEKLVHTEPLSDQGEKLTELRDREAANIIRLLNYFTDAAFEPQGEGQMSDVEQLRAKRISYQTSLGYIATLIRDLWGNVAMKGNNSKFALADELTEEQWKRITDGIDRLVTHAAWTADPDSDEMRALQISWEKNQNAQKAFEGVALDLPYLLIGSSHSTYKNMWNKT